jgi:hypothetical protein
MTNAIGNKNAVDMVVSLLDGGNDSGLDALDKVVAAGDMLYVAGLESNPLRSRLENLIDALLYSEQGIDERSYNALLTLLDGLDDELGEYVQRADATDGQFYF